MNRTLARRISEIEAQHLNYPVLLKMPEGKRVRLRGRGDLSRLLLGHVFDKDKTLEQAAAFQLIKESVECDDGLIELTRALLSSPLAKKEDEPKEEPNA